MKGVLGRGGSADGFASPTAPSAAIARANPRSPTPSSGDTPRHPGRSGPTSASRRAPARASASTATRTGSSIATRSMPAATRPIRRARRAAARPPRRRPRRPRPRPRTTIPSAQNFVPIPTKKLTLKDRSDAAGRSWQAQGQLQVRYEAGDLRGSHHTSATERSRRSAHRRRHARGVQLGRPGRRARARGASGFGMERDRIERVSLQGRPDRTRSSG